MALIDFEDDVLKDKVKDYILMMLGAPVVKVELDDKMLDLCVSRVTEMMVGSDKVVNWRESRQVMVLQDGALAHAKIMLGRIRSKFGLPGKSKDKSPVSLPLDGNFLLNEGERQYAAWQNEII